MSDKIFIPVCDHSYRMADIRKNVKIVYNKKYETYCEYHGDDYCDFEDGDELISVTVVK